METWIQNYTAVGDSLLLTAAAALLPIIFFFVALTILKMKGYVAGFFTLLISILVAILRMVCQQGWHYLQHYLVLLMVFGRLRGLLSPPFSYTKLR